MVVVHHVTGYDNFTEYMKKFDNVIGNVHIYFGGSKLPSGESWCEDCVRAQPVIEANLEKLHEDSHFIYVEVGDRPTWKDLNCPFRKDPRLMLMVIPTLLRWKKPQVLVGEQCENPDLVDMLFTDED